MNKAGKIRRIFLDHWETYLTENKGKIRQTELTNVTKMLICRTGLMGSHLYECPKCKHIREVFHSCKSRFCSVCGYIATDNWVVKRFTFLLNCWYHHVVVTVPHGFNWMIKQDREKTLNLYRKCIADTIQEWAKARGYEVGMISFFHSFGSRLQFHPHFHFLVTAGGLKKNGNWHYTDTIIPGQILMPIFKAKFIAGMKMLFKTGQLKTKASLPRVYAQINQMYNKHWQFYTKRITRRAVDTLLYCVRYAKKMILSEARIISYNKKAGTVTIKSGKLINGQWMPLTYKVEHFIKNVIQHIPEKGFKLINYYGFYANRSGKKYALAKQHYEPVHNIGLKWLWRNRQWHREGQDPLECPQCHTPMLLKMISFPIRWHKITIEKIYAAFGLPIQMKMKLEYG